MMRHTICLACPKRQDQGCPPSQEPWCAGALDRAAGDHIFTVPSAPFWTRFNMEDSSLKSRTESDVGSRSKKYAGSLRPRKGSTKFCTIFSAVRLASGGGFWFTRFRHLVCPNGKGCQTRLIKKWVVHSSLSMTDVLHAFRRRLRAENCGGSSLLVPNQSNSPNLQQNQVA
jgi:hypothetical protein